MIPSTPALVMSYNVIPEGASTALIDETSTMRPSRCAIILGKTARQQLIIPFRFTATIRSQSASLESNSRPDVGSDDSISFARENLHARFADARGTPSHDANRCTRIHDDAGLGT